MKPNLPLQFLLDHLQNPDFWVLLASLLIAPLVVFN